MCLCLFACLPLRPERGRTMCCSHDAMLSLREVEAERRQVAVARRVEGHRRVAGEDIVALRDGVHASRLAAVEEQRF